MRAVNARAIVREPLPPNEALVFAEAALRRVLEVIDRRRPVAQLRPLVSPALIDSVIALARAHRSVAATLRRSLQRAVDADQVSAAELFATYTRGQRVHAIAARIELIDAGAVGATVAQPRRPLAALAFRRAASRRSRRVPPLGAACLGPPLVRCTCAEPSSDGPL